MSTPLLYQETLKRALEVTKKYRSLWFFGLFAAPIVNGGVLNFLYQSIQLDPLLDRNVFAAFADVVVQMNIIKDISNLIQSLNSSPSSAFPSVVLSLLVLLSGAFVFWLMVVSLDALINGARLGLKNAPFTIKEGLKIGRTSFWSIAAMLAGSALVVSVIFTLLRVLFSINTKGNWWMLVGSVAAVFVLMALMVFVYFIAFYSIAGVILKRSPWKNAILEGWSIAKNHWLMSMEVSIILFLVTLLVGIVGFALIFLFIGLPLYFLLYAANIGLQWTVPGGSERALQLLLYVLVVGMWGILTAFQIVAWTAIYLQIQKNVPIQSRILHVIQLLRPRRRSTPTLPDEPMSV